MALDGIVISHLVKELREVLIQGKIDKINQPEKDELIFSIRNNKQRYKLLMTTEAAHPRVHLTDVQKKNPMTAPSLCMLFRKHLLGGRIIDIQQIKLDRIIIFTVEHFDEMNDIKQKRIIVEIMGRHSNIILVDEDNLILESVKRVSAAMSSHREVFPGRTYQEPPTATKHNLIDVKNITQFKEVLIKTEEVAAAISKSFYGISYLVSDQLCLNADLDPSSYVSELSDADYEALYFEIAQLINIVISDTFKPYVILNDALEYDDFHTIDLNKIDKVHRKYFNTISEILDDFYKTKARLVRIKQKTTDLRKLVKTHLDRNYKKLDLQAKQLDDSKDKEALKLKGELIQANLYQIPTGSEKIELDNYYDGSKVNITLDPNLSPVQNANKYFDKYNKKKRTEVALLEQIEITKQDISYLESIQYSLENPDLDVDISSIRSELVEAGYLRNRGKVDKRYKPKKPFHYVSPSGFHMYVGRNNEQNESLSMKTAKNSDWWFHTKDIPGSHVIVVTQGQELPDEVYEQAAALAAYYSKGKGNTKVTVDYVQKKHLRKPAGSPPGYVIYHTNYSMHIEPSIEGLTAVLD